MFCGRRHCADGRDRVEDHVEDLVKPVLAAQWARTAAAPIAKPSTSASGLLGACPDCLRRGCRRADLAPTGKRHLFTHAGIEPRAKKFAAAAVKGLAEWFVEFRDGRPTLIGIDDAFSFLLCNFETHGPATVSFLE